MINYIDLINFGAAVGGLVVSLLCLILSLSVPLLTKKQRCFFAMFFSILVLYIASDLTSQISIVFWQDGFWQLSKTSIFFESLFSSMLLPMFTIYMLRVAGENYKQSPFFYAACSVWAVYAALLLITQFTDVIYFFTPDNVYHRGVLYPILLIPPAMLILINLLLLFRKRHKIDRDTQIALVIYLIIPLIYRLYYPYFP